MTIRVDETSNDPGNSVRVTRVNDVEITYPRYSPLRWRLLDPNCGFGYVSNHAVVRVVLSNATQRVLYWH